MQAWIWDPVRAQCFTLPWVFHTFFADAASVFTMAIALGREGRCFPYRQFGFLQRAIYISIDANGN